MGGMLLLAGFEACGVATTMALALRREKLVQVWLGLALGLLYMMWAPALFAFFLRFTLAAQFCGLGLAAACAGGAWVWRRVWRTASSISARRWPERRPAR